MDSHTVRFDDRRSRTERERERERESERERGSESGSESGKEGERGIKKERKKETDKETRDIRRTPGGPQACPRISRRWSEECKKVACLRTVRSVTGQV